MTIDDFIGAIRLMRREWDDFEITLSGRAANQLPGGKVYVALEFEVGGQAPSSAQVDTVLDILHGRQTKPAEDNPTTSGEQASLLDPPVSEVGGEEDERPVNF